MKILKALASLVALLVLAWLGWGEFSAEASVNGGGAGAQPTAAGSPCYVTS